MANLTPEEVADGVFRLPLPLPNGLQVNAYALRGYECVRLIDAGFCSPDCFEAMTAQLRALGIRISDLTEIVLTHADSDHGGLAIELGQASTARVLVHQLELRRRAAWPQTRAWLDRGGYPASPVALFAPAELPADCQPLMDGAVLGAGTDQLEALWCPGHAPGHLCLYDPDRKLLFSGDHVLKGPTPILQHAGMESDPVGDYLKSLDRVAQLAVEKVLPGHGRPFGSLRDRIGSIRSDLEDLARRVEGAMKSPGASAWEIACLVDPEIVRADLLGQQLHLLQVLAQLRHLESRPTAPSIDS